MPGVSTNTIWASGVVKTPWIDVRVVCGWWAVIASFSPMNALSKVDLPAFGRPAIETKPVRCGDAIRLRRPPGTELALVKHGPLPLAYRSLRGPLRESHRVPLLHPASARGPAIRLPNR